MLTQYCFLTAISQVEKWLDDLHVKRQLLELSWQTRKTQLEQCLALALLAKDLRELEDRVSESRELLANTDHLGKILDEIIYIFCAYIYAYNFKRKSSLTQEKLLIRRHKNMCAQSVKHLVMNPIFQVTPHRALNCCYMNTRS